MYQRQPLVIVAIFFAANAGLSPEGAFFFSSTFGLEQKLSKENHRGEAFS